MDPTGIPDLDEFVVELGGAPRSRTQMVSTLDGVDVVEVCQYERDVQVSSIRDEMP